MDEELKRSYGRWRQAEELGREDEADAAFQMVFSAVPAPEPSPEFTRNVLRAVAVTAARDARHARRVRVAALAGGALGGAAAVYFGAGLALSAVSSGLVWLLDALVAVAVRSASAMDNGADVWTVIASLGRAAAAFVADPKVTFTIVAIQGIAVAALVALQRLLGADGESFK
jgi:hypothetical protein